MKVVQEHFGQANYPNSMQGVEVMRGAELELLFPGMSVMFTATGIWIRRTGYDSTFLKRDFVLDALLYSDPIAAIIKKDDDPEPSNG